MKAPIAAVLCAALLAAPFRSLAETNCPPATNSAPTVSQNDKSMPCVLFVIGSAIVAGYIIWTIKSNCHGPGSVVTMVLDRSSDMVNWTPIATNTVTISTGAWVELFREKIDELRDPNAYYRCHIQR